MGELLTKYPSDNINKTQKRHNTKRIILTRKHYGTKYADISEQTSKIHEAKVNRKRKDFYTVVIENFNMSLSDRLKNP